jgi:hypothetical protein
MGFVNDSLMFNASIRILEVKLFDAKPKELFFFL